MKEVYETLAKAEDALLHAESVRFATFKAVEKAREVVNLKAAGAAAELLLHATHVAANAFKDAEIKALKAWQSAATRSLEHSIIEKKWPR